MAVRTENIYGSITIGDYAIAMLASHTATECYGVVDVVSRRLSDTLADIFRRTSGGKGVKVSTIDSRIYLNLYVIIKAGVNVDAVVQSLKDSVKYNVETVTGMRVMEVTVTIMGIRV